MSIIRLHFCEPHWTIARAVGIFVILLILIPRGSDMRRDVILFKVLMMVHDLGISSFASIMLRRDLFIGLLVLLAIK